MRAAPRTIAAGKGSGKADGQFPRTVKHFKGETTVSAQPQRVVAVSTGQSDALLTLGIAPVGVGSPDGTETVPQYLKDAFPDQASELQKTVSIGSRTEPSVEEIAKLKPDLILVNKAGKGDSAALYKSLSAIAPTVVTEGTGVNWKSDFLLLADALGKRDAAQQRLDAFHASAKALAEAWKASSLCWAASRLPSASARRRKSDFQLTPVPSVTTVGAMADRDL